MLMSEACSNQKKGPIRGPHLHPQQYGISKRSCYNSIPAETKLLHRYLYKWNHIKILSCNKFYGKNNIYVINKNKIVRDASKFHVVMLADMWVYFFTDQTTVAGNAAWVDFAASCSSATPPNYKAVATTWNLASPAAILFLLIRWLLFYIILGFLEEFVFYEYVVWFLQKKVNIFHVTYGVQIIV